MKKSILSLTLLLAGLFAAQAQTGYKIGDKVADFKLKNVDGKMVSMSDFRQAKGFVVIFTCNHCPYAVAYEDRIIALDKKYKTLGYPVIAINPNDPEAVPADSYDKMKERATEKGFTFPYLFDDGQKVYPVWGATRTPHVFVVQKQSKDLVVKYIGTLDNNWQEPESVTQTYLADAIDALISGKTPNPETTKAVGCTIKVKK